MLDTALKRKRLVGTLFLAVLLVLFVTFNRAPKLDTVREDIDTTAGVATSERAENLPTSAEVSAAGADLGNSAAALALLCFQGFCARPAPETSFGARWWDFSSEYLQLVTIGMVFAFLVAGLTEVFLFPRHQMTGFRATGWRGSLQGILVGAPMTLCSACIVPVANALGRGGARAESIVATVQASSTLNLPAMIMLLVVFTPTMAGARIGISVIGALILGPVVAYFAGRHGHEVESPIPVLELPEDRAWGSVLRNGLRDWPRASLGYFIRLGPIMVIAALLSGLVIQFIDESTVQQFLGNNVQGIALAALIGILINVPLLFEIPLVALLLVIGMGEAPAATMLFTAAAGGPITFWGLARVLPKRAVLSFGAGTWVLGAAAGLGVLALIAAGAVGEIGLRDGIVSAASNEEETEGAVAEEDLADAEQAQAATSAEGSQATTELQGDWDGPTFSEVSAEAGIDYRQLASLEAGQCVTPGLRFCETDSMTGGAATADYDNDGWPDLYVTRLDGPDRLYRNRGDGSFEDRTADAGLDIDLATNGAAWGDFDNDGDADLFVTTIGFTRFHLFINDGTGHFLEDAVDRGVAVDTGEQHIGFSVAVGDFDRDGWLDLHTTEWGSHQFLNGAPAHARLLRNRGAEAPGYFEDVTQAAGVAQDQVVSQTGFERRRGAYAFASAFVDLDQDGWPDLAIASDFGKSRLYWNNHDGTFTDGTLAAPVGSDENGMGSTFGDYDGDGDLDWFVTSIRDPDFLCAGFPATGDSDGGLEQQCEWGSTGNRLYQNDGRRGFVDVTDEARVRDGFWGWGAVFLDFDNDADLDLVMTNGVGFPGDGPFEAYRADPMRLWDNDGDGQLREVSQVVGVMDTAAGKGLLTFDYDRDGDLDVFVVNNAAGPALYRNDGGNAKPWIRVRVVGERSNRDGIGARLELRVAAASDVQVREVGVRSHFLGQSELTEHFGLGSGVTSVATLTVTWPVSGLTTVLRDVPANSTIVVREGVDGFVVDSAVKGVSG